MIKDWEYHSLYMDFSSMYEDGNHPSDIDMFYLGKDGVLIIGEIKNRQGRLKHGQRKILESLAEGWSNDALVLFITHNSFWQKGDRTVDVGECKVQEIYYKSLHKWRRPRNYTTVRQVIDYYMLERKDDETLRRHN